jgi:hypothetical protein
MSFDEFYGSGAIWINLRIEKCLPEKGDLKSLVHIISFNTNVLIYVTPHPPPQGGRVGEGVMSLYLLRLY